jgi:cytochrome P450
VRALLNSEPPDHTRLSVTTSRELAPTSVAKHELAVTAFIDSLLDSIEPPVAFDAVPRLAAPLPTFAVARAMGVPEVFAHTLSPDGGTIDLRGIPTTCAHAQEIRADLTENPRVLDATDAVEDMLWGDAANGPAEAHSRALQNIRDAVDAGSLTPAEAVAHVTEIVGAGLDILTTLATSALGLLLSHPDELAKVRQNLDWIPMMLEEVLRFAAPIARVPRQARQDFEIDNIKIRQGDLVMGMVAIANRDPAQFVEPDRFQVDRFVEHRSIGHLTFGRGRHLCPGANLARQEVEILIRRMLERFDDIQLVDDELQWVPHWEVRQIGTLPIRINS